MTPARRQTTALLTGFPGFIGRRLVARLLADDSKLRVAAVVEARMAERAREVAAEIDGDRVEILPGDIAEPHLGLDDDDYERLRADVRLVFHLAAIYDLAVPLSVAQRVNVDGTGNVVDFCLAAESLERHVYISTAYVAGDRTGVVYEHELALGQGFKNHYESTKFQAEVWVRDEMDDIPTTIYRPAIVVGDSRTGETQKFDGPYYMLRFISSSVERHMPLANIGRGAVPFNVVPVDFIVESMLALAELPDAVGETVHLCDPNPVQSGEVFRLLAELYAGKTPKLRLPAGGVSAALRLKFVRDMYGGTPAESIRYLNHPVRYDTRRANELLAKAGLACPGFRDYAPNMVSYFKLHETDESLAPAPH